MARAESPAARGLYRGLGWTPGDEYRDSDGVPWARYTRDLRRLSAAGLPAGGTALRECRHGRH
ncbi:hypothetical protein RB614_05605 [Phytohabitans sp. ZYX-F-186]|uniref:N-acetyltransferase domain-containing protein n=1 Tax=Phytohabitans maris TaxID=3071409 RepID=A0ABU0ZCB7_9ACTN|nr:hypothetical protein [Phytohabitans sp. ZYX-F-186]MDQ7903996.1 hypothetical protein [Phytohabitans sp. ZYX-F-186]